MFLQITNEPRNYEWGSLSSISDLLGRQASGRPEAELWLGDHPGSPAQILNPDMVDGATTLAQWITADPVTTLGAGTDDMRLGFLLKILAADTPLSLQAHPTLEQAIAGFARENASGIALDASHRNYKDDQHKPEVIYALSESFDALCGFRSSEDSLKTLHNLGSDGIPKSLEQLAVQLRVGLPAAVKWILSNPPELLPGIKEVVAAAHADTVLARSDIQLSTVRMLAVNYPEDPGILLSLLLNRVTLKRGEALYLPAGNIHAYLRGVGVELMAASDNVLRGGLTSKHIDVPELLNVLTFEPIPIPYLTPLTSVDGIESFEPDIPDFRLIRIPAGAQSVLKLEGPAIVGCLNGRAQIRGNKSVITLAQGDFLFVTPDELQLAVDAGGEIFVATKGRLDRAHGPQTSVSD